MTRLLEHAIQAVQNLPAAEQDAIASVILAELEDERRWDEAFARSQDELAQLADKARADIRAGRVKDVSPDEL